MAGKKAEAWNQPVLVAIARHSASAAGGGVGAHGGESANRNHAFHARVERGRIQAHRPAHRVAEQIDALRIHQAVFLQRIDGGARVFHHAAHTRPARVAVVERTGLAHAAAEAALIVSQHRVARPHQRQDGVQVVMVDPHVAELITVSMQPDHGRQLRPRGSVGRIVQVAPHVEPETDGAGSGLTLLRLEPPK